MLIEKFEFTGKDEGLSLLVLGGIHGNETAGTAACRRVISQLNSGELQLLRGKVTFVPVCNPEAHKKDVRCCEENLNRVLKMHDNPPSYEQRLANEICPLIKEHRVMLDLHSTHCAGDVPFAFCDYPDEYNRRVLAGLPVGYVLEGWPRIYAGQTEIKDYSSEWCAHYYGNTGTTLECGYHKEPAAAEIAYKAILNTMKTFGLLAGEPEIQPEKRHILLQSFIIKQKAGELCRAYKHPDKVVRGEKIAQYADGEVLTAPSDGYILLPNHQAEIGTEWYYFGTEKL